MLLERLRLWDGSVWCDFLDSGVVWESASLFVLIVRLLLGQAVGDWRSYYFAKCTISVDNVKLWNALVTLAAFERKILKKRCSVAFP